MSYKPRPFMVTVIALLELLGALIMIGCAIGSFLGLTIFGDVYSGAVTAGICLISALVCLVLFAGFWKGWNLWWYIGIIVSILGIISGLISLFSGDIMVIPSLLITVFVLFYLFKPNVKRYFLD